MCMTDLKSKFRVAQSSPELLKHFQTTFVEYAYAKVFAVIRNYTSNRADAEDITQNLFEELLFKKPLTVFTKILAKNREESDVDKWLFVIARNYCYTYHRLNRNKKHQSFPDQDAEGQIAGGLSITTSFEHDLQLETLLKDFPKDIADILRLKVNQKTNYQIAEILGMTEGKVKMKWKRFIDNNENYLPIINTWF